MKMSPIETTALPPGTMLKQYAIVDSAGFDHQCCLYRAECTRTHRTVMLYEYLPFGLAIRGAAGSQALRGQRDALAKAISSQATRLRAAALIGHPALPTLEDIWQHEGALYAAGAWLPGRSLLTELASRPAPIDAAVLCTWARALCDVLAALHSQGLIHGNLAPPTIRVLDGGGLMLPPLGGPIFEQDAPAWVAPEQHPLCATPSPTGPWTDIYQLSALLHLAMTGLPPPTVIRRWEGAPLERLKAVGTHFSEEFVNATRKGLSMLPSARPRRVSQWLEEAGLPDRRLQSRYDDSDADSSTAPAPRRAPGWRALAPGPAGALRAPRVGHELADDPQDGVDAVESFATKRRAPWAWIAAILAIGGLLGILLVS